MTPANLYPLVTIVHIFADLIFVGGLLLVSFLVLALSFQRVADLERERRMIVGARTLHRCITTPALLVVWACGLWLASSGGWFGAHWLMAKMALVLLLSALHGGLSGALRRAAATPAVVPGWVWRLAASLIVGVVAVIVWLVLLKPF